MVRKYRKTSCQLYFSVLRIRGKPERLGTETDLLRARCHLLHHRQHELAVAIVQIRGIAPHLAKEADFIVGELWQPLVSVAVSLGEELGQGQIHGPGYFRECVEGRDS